MSANANQHRLQRDCRAFTLVELLVVISIITLLASTALFTMFGVREDVRETRARAQVAKINELIMEKWESYQTRALPIRIPAGTDPRMAAAMRLNAVRELMRMELPDRMTDILCPDPLSNIHPSGIPSSSLLRAYFRRVQSHMNPGPDGGWGVAGSDDDGNGIPDDVCEFAWPGSDDRGWSRRYQDSECLYLILSSIRENDSTGLEFFDESEIGDTDNDGMPEILDSWRQPILFLRWAPGYRAYPGNDRQWGIAGEDDNGDLIDDDPREAGWPLTDDIPSPSALQDGNGVDSPDPFDPMKVDPRWSLNDPRYTLFALYPLIVSAGRDRGYAIATENAISPIQYYRTTPPNDPYFIINQDVTNPTDDLLLGKPDFLSPEFADNISNHLLETR